MCACAQVLLATLRYNVDTSYSTNAPGAQASLHEITQPWSSATVTWNSFTGSAGLNTNEYNAAMVSTVYANPAGWHEVDVTASVNSWKMGTLNAGWIFLPTGGGDGSNLRGCLAPAGVRVNLQVVTTVAPPAPPSEPPPGPAAAPRDPARLPLSRRPRR